MIRGRARGLGRALLLGALVPTFGAPPTAMPCAYAGAQSTLDEWLSEHTSVAEALRANRSVPTEELVPFVAELEVRLRERGGEPYADPGLMLWRGLRNLGRDDSLSLEAREDYFRRATREARRFGHATGPANVGDAFGVFLLSQGRNQEALEVVDTALALTPKGMLSNAWLHHTRAEASRSLGRYDEALEHVEAGEAMLDSVPDVYDIVHRLPGQRAQIYLELGLTDLAAPLIEELAGKARAARAEGVGASWIAQAFVDEVSLALFREGPAEAERIARAALEDTALLGLFPTSRTTLQLLLAHALIVLERRDPERAPEAGGVLGELLEDESLPLRTRVLARLQLATAQVDRRDFEAAEATLGAARASIEVWAGDGEVRQPTVELAELRALEARVAIEGERDPAELVALGESLDEALGGLRELWELTPRRAGGVGFLQDAPRRAILSESFRVDRLTLGSAAGALRSLDRLLSAQAMSSSARELRIEAPTVSDLRARYLVPGQGMLFWLFAPMRSHVFALDAEAVTHIELPAHHIIDDSIERYLGALGQPPWSAQDPSALARAERRWARQVSDELLPEPVVERLRAWSAVTIVPSYLSVDVPFEALPVGEEDFLGTWRAVDYLPSAVWALRPRKEVPPAPVGAPELLLLHSPNPAASARARWPEATPLTLEGSTVDALSDLFRGVRSLAGQAAHAGRLAEEERARALCIVAHGVHDFARERPAGLLLSPLGPEDDGVLWTSEVDELPPQRADLVVLAACDASAGPSRVGDGGSSRMAAAWLRNGARVVVHSDADLALEPTLELVRIFLERVRGAGETPAEALRVARAQLARDARWAAPFFHARLRVEGHGHEPLFEPRAEQNVDGPLGSTSARLLALGGALVAGHWMLRTARRGRRRAA